MLSVVVVTFVKIDYIRTFKVCSTLPASAYFLRGFTLVIEDATIYNPWAMYKLVTREGRPSFPNQFGGCVDHP